MTEIPFKHRSIRYIQDGDNVSKSAAAHGIPPMDLKKCASELTPVPRKLFFLVFAPVSCQHNYWNDGCDMCLQKSNPINVNNTILFY